jgi:membrane-associated protease RseP (regulator of RpoE activity)
VLDLLAGAGYILMALLGFAFVIGIHELGHFVFAKWAGVRVDVFSIGFGPVILRRRVGETDYVISLLPLGGYVKMLGQEDLPSGMEAAPDPRSYLAKSAGWKALILLGGVLFNLVSSYLILLALVVWGMPVFHPVVGEVAPKVIDQRGLAVESPAARLGLERGDRIIAVDGERVRSFDDVMTAVLFAGNQPLQVEVERDGRRLVLPPPGAEPVQPIYDGRFGRPSLGIEFPWSNRVVFAADGPADGIRRFDRIVAIAGEDVSGLLGQDIHDRLSRHLGRAVPVTVERDGERIELSVAYAGPDGAFDVRAGVPVRLAAASGPAAAAGLRAGDWIVAVAGAPVAGGSHALALVRSAIAASTPVAMTVQRDGARIDAVITPVEIHGVARIGIALDHVDRGVLALLPPALDGGPGLLERTGLKPGDALIGWTPGESDVAIAWLPGGSSRTIPLGMDAAAWKAANRWTEAGIVQRILGQQPEPGLAELVSGTRVAEKRATALVLQPRTGPARTVALPRLGAAADRLAVGDWIVDARLGSEGPLLEVVAGAGEPRTATLAPPPIGTVVILQPEELPYQPESAGDAIGLVNGAAYNLVVKGVQLIPRLFRSPEQGGVDPNKALHGPIGIFREMKARFELMGFDSFLKLVALVGLNLFVVNLLPIPITDGGQLLMLGVETAMRRPLPLALRNALMWMGVVMVGALFIYICGLDILRWLGLAG